MSNGSTKKRKQYIFVIKQVSQEACQVAKKYLVENGVKVLERHGDAAIIGMATEEQVEFSHKTNLFSIIASRAIKKEHLKKLSEEQQKAVRSWNNIKSDKYRKLRKDKTLMGKSWGEKDKDPPAPIAFYAPEDFKASLLEHLQIDEKELLKKYKKKKYRPLKGNSFIRYEKELAKIYKDETIAYHLARIAFQMEPIYQDVIRALPIDFIEFFFIEPACWKMEGEISVGVVFVESSRTGGPKFSTSERNTLQANIADGFNWLATQASFAAHLTWVYDWQFVQIDVANGTNSSDEAYWRNPAMGQVNYNSNTYGENWSSVADYREDMRRRNLSQHAFVIFVTPYANSWHAYAGGGRVTLAKRNNWGGWGINTIDMITAHEACHLFGAADEYTGSGTPCSSCGTLHGCNSIPNGNCGSCARPQQNCVMDGNSRRLCAYTQGHIGWTDLFVELGTTDTTWAGTDDNVWLDIGDRTFFLDNPNHDDRERGNIEGYALRYTGVSKSDVKRVGIRKSPDGFAGGWKLRRVKLWCRGELICEENNINQWLEDEYLWWASSTCGSSSDIVNRLQVKVTTADVSWAGTDDNVRIYLGGRSWNLDNPGRNDFERGRTDTFDLDPGTSLYRPMISSIRIYKSPDGIAGGWKLKGLQIFVNGVRIYNNQSINKWMEDDDRNWYGMI
ncbi:MAG: hypothetical protein AMS22_03690 [Thiotrichales bacterium SG8_50]|nr:MAG: hypothetical protein AMS22_03690 [Thiotrichales bacterium SG8_50]